MELVYCFVCLNIRSYRRAHFVADMIGDLTCVLVLLILFNELGKSDKMRGLPSILSLFSNEFNKFNNTGARILDSIYHTVRKRE